MSFNGVGPSFTCVRLLQGMSAAGASCGLVLDRATKKIERLDYRTTVPGALSFIPYRYVQPGASRASESYFLRQVQAGDIAYLWPSVSLETHRILRDRGHAIILEGINTRMASARKVLDQAYRNIGLEPAHGITEERIVEEEAKLELASAIFAPSPVVEDALKGSPLADGGVIPASYGVDLPDWKRSDYRGEDPLKVLFVGYACVRKGVNTLLEAWDRSRIKGELIIAGTIEPAIASRYSDLLSRPDVRPLGFVKDVLALYRSADLFVLPSLEEGDPLVTYEAAAHGLPLMVSQAGAGRMGGQEGGIYRVDPYDVESLVEGFRTLSQDSDRREFLGRGARAVVENFRWSDAGSRRVRSLRDHLARLA